MIEFKTESGWGIHAYGRNDVLFIDAIQKVDGREFLLNTTSGDDNRMYLCRGGISLTDSEANYLSEQLRNASQRG